MVDLEEANKEIRKKRIYEGYKPTTEELIMDDSISIHKFDGEFYAQEAAIEELRRRKLDKSKQKESLDILVEQ